MKVIWRTGQATVRDVYEDLKTRRTIAYTSVQTMMNILEAKGHLPFIPLVERLEIVRHISWVDDVYAETVPDKVDTWGVLRFDRIFKGDDWRGTPKGERLEADFAPLGVEVVYLPYTAHTSSTELRRALLALSAPTSPGMTGGVRGVAVPHQR